MLRHRLVETQFRVVDLEHCYLLVAVEEFRDESIPFVQVELDFIGTRLVVIAAHYDKYFVALLLGFHDDVEMSAVHRTVAPETNSYLLVHITYDGYVHVLVQSCMLG